MEIILPTSPRGTAAGLHRLDNRKIGSTFRPNLETCTQLIKKAVESRRSSLTANKELQITCYTATALPL